MTSTTHTQSAYFAGGCFWGLERYYQGVDGVVSTQVGYAQSTVANPSYEEVCTGRPDAVETVRVDFDPDTVTLKTLGLLLLDVIDPYAVNKQGNDVGRQYRSGMYWTDETQKATFDEVQDLFAALAGKRSAVEVTELTSFYEAEEYHQDYLEKNPGGYCHISFAKIARVAKRAKYIEKVAQLNPLQYAVTQHAYTERPFDNPYDQLFEPGIYVDIVSGEPLFVSTDKYDAQCGWPSFSKPIDASKLEYVEDHKIPGRPRTEVRVIDSGIHLGHVFDDGPQELGGQRYCTNSASLRFVPRGEMEKQGYSEYLDLVDHS